MTIQRAYMKVQGGNVNVIEKFAVILDRITAGEEDNHLLVQTLFQKGEQQQESLVTFADYIALF